LTEEISPSPPIRFPPAERVLRALSMFHLMELEGA
jgi:hypothetical protein